MKQKSTKRSYRLFVQECGDVLRKQMRAKLKTRQALILVGEVSREYGLAMHFIRGGFISSHIIELAEEP